MVRGGAYELMGYIRISRNGREGHPHIPEVESVFVITKLMLH